MGDWEMAGQFRYAHMEGEGRITFAAGDMSELDPLHSPWALACGEPLCRNEVGALESMNGAPVFGVEGDGITEGSRVQHIYRRQSLRRTLFEPQGSGIVRIHFL